MEAASREFIETRVSKLEKRVIDLEVQAMEQKVARAEAMTTLGEKSIEDFLFVINQNINEMASRAAMDATFWKLMNMINAMRQDLVVTMYNLCGRMQDYEGTMLSQVQQGLAFFNAKMNPFMNTLAITVDSMQWRDLELDDPSSFDNTLLYRIRIDEQDSSRWLYSISVCKDYFYTCCGMHEQSIWVNANHKGNAVYNMHTNDSLHAARIMHIPISQLQYRRG